jgi:hypothetical protein
MYQHTRYVLAAALAAGAVNLVNADGKDGEEGKCEIRKVTPNWSPECPGEFGDTMGLLALTDDGSEVAYSSYSTFCLPGAEDMHGHIQQIIVRNTHTQEGELISVAYNPKPGQSIAANAHNEWYLDISPNGRYVVFASLATNLVPEEVTGEFFQTYVRDRHEQVTYLVSRSPEGEQANDWGSDVRLGVSNNGKVAFASRANNLHPDQPNIMWAVYVHDVHTGITELVSRDVNGDPAQIDSWGPAISADGTTVAFVSIAPLVPGLPFLSQDVYVRDLVNNTTEIVSVDADGQNRPGAGGHFPRLSHDGNRVAFRYDSFVPLDPTFPQGWLDVLYVRDRSTNVTVGFSRAMDEQGATVNPEGGFTISGDGQYVAWDTIDQVTDDPINPIWHVYRTHVDTLESELVTLDRFCQPIPEMHDQMYSAISGDGNTVVFNSMWHVMYDDDFDWSRHLYTWTDPNAETECALADLNCDGIVDGADLLILLSSWGQCQKGDDCDADLNGDGIVDGADLLILLANWG